MKRIYTLIIVILVSMDCWGLLSCEARQVAGFGITNPASEPHQVELVQSATAEAQFWNQLETQTLLYPPHVISVAVILVRSGWLLWGSVYRGSLSTVCSKLKWCQVPLKSERPVVVVIVVLKTFVHFVT